MFTISIEQWAQSLDLTEFKSEWKNMNWWYEHKKHFWINCLQKGEGNGVVARGGFGIGGKGNIVF